MNLRKMALALLVAAGMLATAWAQSYIHGRIRRITDQGLYLQTAKGVTYIKHSNSNTFMVADGDVRLNYPELAVDQEVRVAYGDHDELRYVPHAWWEDHPNRSWTDQLRAYDSDKSRWEMDHPEGSLR